MGNKTGMRADKTKVEEILNPKNSWGQYVMSEGESRLRKDLSRYTMSCDLNDCDGDGYYDNIGEVVCEECGRVISQKPDGPTDMVQYSDKYCQGSNDPESGQGNRGASGHPLMRVPSLRSAGPSGDGKGGGTGGSVSFS